MRRLALTFAAVLVLAGGAAAIELRTDTSNALVPLDEIIPGGPPPDGILSIDHPTFVTPADAAAWLRPKELRPRIFGVQAHWPARLEANYIQTLHGYRMQGVLPPLAKEAMHVAVSMTNHCNF